MRRTLVNVGSLSFDAATARAWIDDERAHCPPGCSWVVVSDEGMSGNPHTGGHAGLLSKEVADRIAATVPDAHVLAVIRNQRTIIDSVYRQYVRIGGTLDIDEYLSGRWRATMPSLTFSYEHFEYHRLIGYYHKVLGPERVHVRAFEDLVADREAFLRDLCATLDIPFEHDLVAASASRVNASMSRMSIALMRPANRFDAKHPLNRRVIADVPAVRRAAKRATSWLDGREAIKRYNRKPGLLRDDVLEAIDARYAASNTALAEMTGIDLASRGYPCA